MGIDEAGRGCLIGPVFIAGVILPNNIYELLRCNNNWFWTWWICCCNSLRATWNENCNY
ncbi:MAG: hypothetical protein EBS12_01575 [Flavobacteriia bacterium]|nr:hypothetical protein [Flavobacteriia bacterium]